MQIKELKSEGLNKEYKVVVAAKKIAEELDKTIEGLAKTVKMAGFRAGKVPVSMVKKKYASSAKFEILEKQISEGMQKIISDHSLSIATQPQIQDIVNEENKDLEFTVKVEVLPEIKMPDFSKIKLEKPVLDVQEKDIEEALNRVAKNRQDFKPAAKTAKVKDGDMVVIDFVGRVDGKEFAGGAAQGVNLVIGSGSFIKGYEEQLIGLKAGDEKLVKVTFPEEYHAQDLAGKPAEFDVKVVEVQNAVLPEINDEFAQKMKFKDLAELKARMKDQLTNSYNEQIHTLMKMRLFDALEKELKFEVPASILDKEFNALWEQVDQLRKVDEELKKKSEKELKDYYHNIALRRVRIGLMLSEYAKSKKLSITQKEVQEAVIAQARSMPGYESQVIEYYTKNANAVESLKGPIIEDKAVRQIFEKEVALTEKNYKSDKLDKMLEEETNRDVV